MDQTSITRRLPKRVSFVDIIQKKRSLIIDTTSALFILLFLYTALTKTIQIGSTVRVLDKTPFFQGFPEITAWTVVITEYIIVALLFFPRTKKLGLLTSLILMGLFTFYITYMKIFVPNLPCTCGGAITKLTWNQHLAFNLVFIVLALNGILLNRKRANPIGQ